MHVKYHASKVKRYGIRLTWILDQELPEMVLFKSVLTLATVSSGSTLWWLQYWWDDFRSHEWLWRFRYLLISWHLLNSFSGHTGLGESWGLRNPSISSFLHCLLMQACLLSSTLTPTLERARLHVNRCILSVVGVHREDGAHYSIHLTTSWL